MAIEITRKELTAAQLRCAASKTNIAAAARRMLALALEGVDREAAARSRSMARQTLRDQVHRCNSEGLAGLVNRRGAGRWPQLSAEQKAALAARVEKGPDPEADPEIGGVVRWRRIDLKQWIEAEFGVVMHERKVGKKLAASN